MTKRSEERFIPDIVEAVERMGNHARRFLTTDRTFKIMAARRSKLVVVERYAPDDMQIPAKLGGGKLKELIIRDAKSREVIRYSLAYINPAICAEDNGRVLGYDNSHGASHKHSMGSTSPDGFTTYEELYERFQKEWHDIALSHVNRGGMPRKAKLTLDDFRVLDKTAERGRKVARALDRKAELPYPVELTTHQFQNLIVKLTPGRFDLLRMSKGGKSSIADLAAASNRDSSAVSKDVAILQALGLVKVETVPNAGHGVKKVVAPVAARIEIRASIEVG